MGIEKKRTRISENDPNEFFRTGLSDSNTVNQIDLI